MSATVVVGTPDASTGAVFEEVKSIISEVLDKADSIYADAEENLNYIKGLVQSYSINYGIMSDLGIEDAGYKEIDFVSMPVQSVDIAMDESVVPPENLELGEIESNIEFDDTIESVDRTIIEPDVAQSSFNAVARTIYSDRPEDVELGEISTDVSFDSVEKPVVEFIFPPLPDLPSLSNIPYPDFTFNYNEGFYTSELGTYLYNLLLEELQNGSTGLNEEIESDIYARESERDLYELEKTKDRMARLWSESGMALPDGVLLSALSKADIEYQNKYSDKSRDVRIESFKRADDNAKFVKDLTVKYESILMDYMGKYWDRQLEASKAVLAYVEAFYDALIKYQSLFIEQYKAQVEGYKATVEGQAAELEAKAKVYLGDIQYVTGKADSELKQIGAEIDIQKNEIAKEQVEVAKYDADIKLGSLYVDNYKSDIDNYKAVYTGRIANLDTQIKAFQSDVQYEVDKADVELKRVASEVEIQKSEISAKQIEIETFDTTVKYETAKADIEVKSYATYFDQYKTLAAMAQTNAQISDIDARFQIGKLQSKLESTKQQIDLLRVSIDAAIAATGDIAQVSSTMVAGAMSAVNANASMGTSESQGAQSSYSDSTSTQISQSGSTSYIYQHNYEE